MVVIILILPEQSSERVASFYDVGEPAKDIRSVSRRKMGRRANAVRKLKTATRTEAQPVVGRLPAGGSASDAVRAWAPGACTLRATSNQKRFCAYGSGGPMAQRRNTRPTEAQERRELALRATKVPGLETRVGHALFAPQFNEELLARRIHG